MNKNLFVISFGWILYFLLCISPDEETNSFICFKLHIQIGNHEIKIVNFADNNTNFLRDITCHNRIQVILKPNENANKN